MTLRSDQALATAQDKTLFIVDPQNDFSDKCAYRDDGSLRVEGSTGLNSSCGGSTQNPGKEILEREGERGNLSSDQNILVLAAPGPL
jgi:hypothetical protein